MQEQISRQEQLDAVARNYGEWLLGSEFAYWKDGEVRYTNAIIKSPQVLVFARIEVEQRKAELQNKPKISDIPDWANWRAQDEDGIWRWYEQKPTETSRPIGWYVSAFGTIVFAGKGEVIGDWRDTLEEIKREPKIDKDVKDKNAAQSLTEGSMLAHTAQLQADSQEYVGTNTADYDMSIHSNPDAAARAKFFQETLEEQKWTIDDIDESLMLGWFANAMMAMHDHVLSEKEKTKKDWDGEGLPPVGCTTQTSVGQCVILAVDENRKEAAVQWLNDGALGVINLAAIKPIKSERDRWIDEAAARMGTFKGSECEWYLAAVYDSLVNGYLEMPKLENK